MTSVTQTQKPACRTLVLDAGPLLSLSPLRGLAETFVTVPQVLAELKDKNAKEHLERLGLNYGIKIEVKNPSPASIASVIQWAKKTGDYSVLSHPDICVLALTHTLHEEAEKKQGTQPESDQKREDEGPSVSIPAEGGEETTRTTEDSESQPVKEEETPSLDDEREQEPLNVELHPIEDKDAPSTPTSTSQSASQQADAPLYEDPSDSDDGEGEWITPTNVGLHKSRALDLLPSDGGKKGKGKAKNDFISVGCMTADFAMQNVLLQMGLNLVGTEGKRIQRVKTWNMQRLIQKVLSFLREPFAASSLGDIYKTRGTKYSIPAPKPGSAKTGPGEGLILREDQAEYMRAQKRADNKREREEAKMMKGVFSKGLDGGSVAVGSWMDPDWIPEIMSASSGGKGRSTRGGNDMPTIGYGRKNPNERRRKA
ncbi:20S-pre-rRNA D-site endonuclease nob1 [Marasmius tenuissimus]|uniref:20S-pre-rRNA D-site endonuclease NOB1 n=1 Tax=Marasmius tenuissimus TaxID=585030 RepID=A0ABR3A2G0_9AGAR